MPQDLRQVNLKLLSGEILYDYAIAVGNNAAWKCVGCKKTLLIGRTALIHEATWRSQVNCNNKKYNEDKRIKEECTKSYYVVPTDKNQGRTDRVIEIKRIPDDSKGVRREVY